MGKREHTIPISDEIWDAFKSLCDEERRYPSHYIELLMERELDKFGELPKHGGDDE